MVGSVDLCEREIDKVRCGFRLRPREAAQSLDGLSGTPKRNQTIRIVYCDVLVVGMIRNRGYGLGHEQAAVDFRRLAVIAHGRERLCFPQKLLDLGLLDDSVGSGLVPNPSSTGSHVTAVLPRAHHGVHQRMHLSRAMRLHVSA